MKETTKYIMFMAAMTMMIMTTACSGDSLDDDDNNTSNAIDNGEYIINEDITTSTLSTMKTFTISIDKTTAEPAATVAATYPAEGDSPSANTFGTIVNIDLSNPAAAIVNGVTITVSGNDITANHGSTEGICYVVTGTLSDGSLTIKGDASYELNLHNANITNLRSTAINLQSSQNAYLTLSGTNTVTDGTTADDSHKGAIFAKGKLFINGTGSLEVYGTYNNGIHGKSNVVIESGVNLYVNSSVNHGIKGGSDIIINGGIVNVEVSGLGAKAINGDVNVTINGGRTTAIATGNGKWEADETLSTGGDTKAAAGIGCDGIFYMNGGELYAKATGSGGKGVKADLEGYITGGTIRIITEGGLYYSNGTTESHDYTGNTDNLASAYTSSPKGMKIGYKDDTVTPTETYGKLQISGGNIMVRTSGNNAEGIESKGTFDISGGTVMVYAHDDALNSTGDMTVSGGNVVAVGTNNDAIDSNGDMYLKGGTIIACGGSGAETGIDVNEQKKLYISGGNIFSIGGRTDGNLGSTTQGIINASGSVAENSIVSVSSNGTTLCSFLMPTSFSNGTIFISSPTLTSGSSYTLSNGSSSTTVTASSTISGSTMGGGGMPGGRKW
ncbi:MAG: carbohydrate-binding domain-containing protein [Prevotella sp.]|nr:carbohydrate-binding domain-containing protein [Prevotella sp.]